MHNFTGDFMEGRVTIQAPGLIGETPRQIELHPGQSAEIGVCHCGQCDLDLRIGIAGLPPLRGRITATDGFWMISNLSGSTPITAQKMDDWYQYLVVEPGREDVPVPFELTQIELSIDPAGPKLAVFGQEPRYAKVPSSPDGCDERRAPRTLLDQEATYFAVLRELCKRRLAGAMDTSLPTSTEIAASLRPRYRGISPRAVDAHIKYVSEKLSLPKGIARETLAAVVMRSQLLERH